MAIHHVKGIAKVPKVIGFAIIIAIITIGVMQDLRMTKYESVPIKEQAMWWWCSLTRVGVGQGSSPVIQWNCSSESIQQAITIEFTTCTVIMVGTVVEVGIVVKVIIIEEHTAVEVIAMVVVATTIVQAELVLESIQKHSLAY